VSTRCPTVRPAAARLAPCAWVETRWPRRSSPASRERDWLRLARSTFHPRPLMIRPTSGRSVSVLSASGEGAMTGARASAVSTDPGHIACLGPAASRLLRAFDCAPQPRWPGASCRTSGKPDAQLLPPPGFPRRLKERASSRRGDSNERWNDLPSTRRPVSRPSDPFIPFRCPRHRPAISEGWVTLGISRSGLGRPPKERGQAPSTVDTCRAGASHMPCTSELVLETPLGHRLRGPVIGLPAPALLGPASPT